MPRNDKIAPGQDTGGRHQKRPPPPSRERLLRQALQYLERFATSSERLRHLLNRRLRAAAEHHGISAESAAALVDSVLQDLLAQGLLDDRAFAEARARRLARDGRSGHRIRQSLRAKGLASEEIAQAMLKADDEASEIERARAHAARRRLGPFRQPPQPGLRQKDLAAMARAGFSFSVAKAVIDGEAYDPERLALADEA